MAISNGEKNTLAGPLSVRSLENLYGLDEASWAQTSGSRQY